jgi:phosphoribosylglycinamide formyltransferase-1
VAKRVVVLVSGAGTLLQALLDAGREGRLGPEIVAVGSDRPDAQGLTRARAANLPVFVREVGADRAAWDAAFTQDIAAHSPDIVVSAGFMKLLGPVFLARYAGRAVNSHPALLPSFPGAHAVRDALAAGVKVTGATVFAIDAGVDTGPILAQEPVRVEPGDTEEALHERIKAVERRMLVDVLNRLETGEWT